MAKQLMPEASLEPRDSDVPLTEDQFLQTSLFAPLERKPGLDRFPGALILRHFRKGEEICRQGEAGWTAFYILTGEDVLTLRLSQLHSDSGEFDKKELAKEVSTLEQSVEIMKSDPAAGNERRQVATVHLAIAKPESKKGTWWQRFARGLASGPKTRERPLYIPIDGPTDINYDTLQAAMYEGELFGEMSCLQRTPRSATVVATRDCYMLEMLRNILDQLQKDLGYKARMEALYKSRVFELHLRNLPVFGELTEQQFAALRDQVDLLHFEPAQIICDEHERSDSVYLIRTGTVKVVKDVSALISMEYVRDWPAFIAALREGESQTGLKPALSADSPRDKIWQLLAEGARALIRQVDPNKVGGMERLEIIFALNDVIKNSLLSAAKELQALLKSDAVSRLLQELPPKKADWSEQDTRKLNRILLEQIYPGNIRRYRRVGPERILCYCSRGEVLGEIGLLAGQPRGATCLAFGQQVELVRIPGTTFRDLMEASPGIAQKVAQEIAARQARTQERIQTPIWEESDHVLLSPQAEKLGLIQGQKLMLIDLDRCTRCDECVQACVHTHDDGLSRLFLDGPRFGKYLVPASCRSCLDPVCMIGCPVGSIHRGDNGQIMIEDWCIGCGLCAQQCPYGAIQMHDIGLIAEDSRGWRYLPASFVHGNSWTAPGFSDSHWLRGPAPFHNTKEFRARVTAFLKQSAETAASGEDALCFRHEFELGGQVPKNSQLKLEITSEDPGIRVWLNCHEIEPEKVQRGKREFSLPPKPKPVHPKQTMAAIDLSEPAPSSADVLRRGKNVVAVKIDPHIDNGAALLELRLDEVRKPMVQNGAAEEVTHKLVTHHAAVCDLCSSLPSQIPACVNSCPHDAAMRIHASFEFPTS